MCLLMWILISGITIITSQILNRSTSAKDVHRMITGLLCCILVTDVAKNSVGRLRPHFLTLCNPDYNNVCFDEDISYMKLVYLSCLDMLHLVFTVLHF